MSKYRTINPSIWLRPFLRKQEWYVRHIYTYLITSHADDEGRFVADAYAIQAARSARFDGSDPAATCRVPADILSALAQSLGKSIPEINPLLVDACQRMIRTHGAAVVRRELLMPSRKEAPWPTS